jgi:PST family polysaccharide transporter
MSLAHKAARGALWTIVSSMGGRAVGVAGTLVMTRFLYPHQIGEVADATVLAMTANWISIWGFGQYAVVKGRGADAAEVTWHATVSYAVLGAISLGLMALFGGRLAAWFGAPGAAAFVPGMALALFIQRLGAVPERVLTRQLQFRPSGTALIAGEATFTAIALTLAASGMGAMSIVIGKIAQSCVAVAILVRAAGFASWATPTRLSRARFLDMLSFGVPLAIQNIAGQASRYWDRLAISSYFGTAATGAYNMAYNLADIPAVQVGEQIALVLMPSMAQLPPERRPHALERATALLSLIVFPLAVGLGLVAEPLIALILPANQWQEVAPLLAVLACLSVFRPITWVLSAYLEAESKTNRLMLLEVGKVIVLLSGIAALSRYGLHAAASAVGIAFGVNALAGVALVVREGPSPMRLLSGFVRPLAACAVMAACALAVRALLVQLGCELAAVQLAAMVVVGAVAYVGAALVICRETARDLLDLGRKALLRRG